MEKLVYSEYIPVEILKLVKKDKGIFDGYPYQKFLNESFPDIQESLKELQYLKKNFPLDEDFVREYDDIATIFSEYFSFQDNVRESIESIIDDSRIIISIIKWYYNRMRPYQLAKLHNIEIDNLLLDTMLNPSFPSGHSAQSYIIANYLGEIHPKSKKDLLYLADKICVSRMSAKAHYPSDIAFGKVIGSDMANFLIETNKDLSVDKLPFDEEKFKGYVIRSFSKDIASEELKWHTDGEDRTIIPLNENDWMIQLDNELPKPFKGKIFIPEGKYHRVIKGTTDLHIKVIK
jgi:hypothetical protein